LPLRPLGTSLSRLSRSEKVGRFCHHELSQNTNQEVNMEYVIVLGVFAMVGGYALILARCLRDT
jgi:hypothetical protein